MQIMWSAHFFPEMGFKRKPRVTLRFLESGRPLEGLG